MKNGLNKQGALISLGDDVSTAQNSNSHDIHRNLLDLATHTVLWMGKQKYLMCYINTLHHETIKILPGKL